MRKPPQCTFSLQRLYNGIMSLGLGAALWFGNSQCDKKNLKFKILKKKKQIKPHSLIPRWIIIINPMCSKVHWLS